MQTEIVVPHGPSGGWPIIRFTGTHDEMANLITLYACDPIDAQEHAQRVITIDDETVAIDLDIAYGGSKDEPLDEALAELLAEVAK